MGRTTSALSYNPGTNTLSGKAVHNQRVGIHIDGQNPASLFVMAAAADGSWSQVLTGLATGNHTVRASLGNASLSPPLAITKP